MGRKNRRYPAPLDVRGKSRPQEGPLHAHRMATQAWGWCDMGAQGWRWNVPGDIGSPDAQHACAPPERGRRELTATPTQDTHVRSG